MKKVLAIGMLAICAIALSQQQASAWVNHRFAIGLNWERQSGGNNWLWGGYRNGQPPGPEYAPQYHHGHGHQPFFWGSAPQAPAHQHAYEMPSYDYTQPTYYPYQFANYPQYTPYYYGR